MPVCACGLINNTNPPVRGALDGFQCTAASPVLPPSERSSLGAKLRGEWPPGYRQAEAAAAAFVCSLRKSALGRPLPSPSSPCWLALTQNQQPTNRWITTTQNTQVQNIYFAAHNPSQRVVNSAPDYRLEKPPIRSNQLDVKKKIIMLNAAIVRNRLMFAHDGVIHKAFSRNLM